MGKRQHKSEAELWTEARAKGEEVYSVFQHRLCKLNMIASSCSGQQDLVQRPARKGVRNAAPALSCLVGLENAQDVFSGNIWPHLVDEKELRVSHLKKEEVAHLKGDKNEEAYTEQVMKDARIDEIKTHK